MIYNDKFVWLHFPKCAGTKIENLFKEYLSQQEGVFQDPVGINLDPTVAWHDSIAEREARDPDFSLGDRTVICSIRKLPGWLVSRYNFEFKRTPDLPHQPERLLDGKFLEATGYENHADYYIERYLPKTLLKSGKIRFLRTEFFEEDFKSIFGEFLDISTIPDTEYQKSANKSESHVPALIKEEMNSKLKSIYQKSPQWKIVDAMAYGDYWINSYYYIRLMSALGL